MQVGDSAALMVNRRKKKMESFMHGEFPRNCRGPDSPCIFSYICDAKHAGQQHAHAHDGQMFSKLQRATVNQTKWHAIN